MLAEAIKAGSRQRSELRKALEFLYENEEYEKYGFKSLDTALYNAGTKEAEILRDKLYFLTVHNVFVPENDFYIENKINIFRLSRYDLKTQQLIAEILLSYIWRLAMADKFKKSPVYIFLDECHNLSTGRNNTLAQFLAEGRRFGINLILATQIMEEGKTSIVQQRLTQCGVTKPYPQKKATITILIRWHDLRSTYCTLLLKENFNPKAVSKLMGHVKEIITIDMYGDNKNIIADGIPEIEAYMEEVLPDPEKEQLFRQELLEVVVDVSEYIQQKA